MPLARSAGAGAKRQADRTRSWVAPQIDRAGHVVQDSIGPKVSSVLSAAARRLEPTAPRRARWPKLVGASAVAAATSAAAAAVRSRMKAGSAAAPEQTETAGAVPATLAESAPEPGNAQPSTGSDVSQNSEAHTG